MKYTICDSCPCLNNDCDYGSDCNLGYDTSLEWVEKKTGRIAGNLQVVRVNNNDFDLKNVSKNCELVEIITKDKRIVPETFLEMEGA